ncbi:MAG: M20/M25/M40 family metallo-hydrolase [Kordiimonadaceae bacterium]|nr:M20/M25/M40 family metallo-hydrolase [Kordiimonadaceae bacterium]MBO6570101.1 M20/M25/M40 family metallo-hydrolase [Kordiimonadaceae bacterium]MBO6965801.1 M20/M25/M40 family metallo-hydrolase [Kordiimonadaceae bacterium]
MPLQASDIFNKLKEWPHRGVGTEQELEAREMLITLLSAEYEVDIVEEGFDSPPTYIRFFWLNACVCAAAVMGANLMPAIMVLVGLLGFASHFLFIDWRVSPLIWWGAQTPTANLVARKGRGSKLYILMAHLDSAPASFAYRPGQVQNFALSVHVATFLLGCGVLVPLVAGFGAGIDLTTRLVIATAILGQALLASIDFWRLGYTPGANDNLSGVVAATAAASHLWRHMPEDAEVRLVLTSAEEAGMLGAQHYWQTHRDELKARETYLINIDTVGSQELKYVKNSGTFTNSHYDNALTDAAFVAASSNPNFSGIEAGTHKVGDFDSIWFHRDKIPAITIASYNKHALMPAIHTMADTAEKVDLSQVAKAAKFAEALVRMTPGSGRR